MQAQDKVDLFIYRVGDKGLEVYLVNENEADSQWKTLHTDDLGSTRLSERCCIELEPVLDAQGATRKAIAVEADWHELPSLRALIYEDYRVAKEKAKQKIREMIPDTENGAFVAVKEALKKVMPEQYAFLKELKDILTDKNQTTYI
ncbi:MAG: hypothetical protein RL742_499 [Bacteroidota bacterium]|jgi:hypothetical protein